MIKFIRERIAVKVALYVNLLLLIVLAAGSTFIIIQQSKKLEKQLLEKGRVESLVGAKMIGRVIEEAVDNGVFGVKEAFDTEYEQIPGFDPPKYHSKYDFYLDKSILGVEDEFLKDESVLFAVAVDVNGYLPTHNTKYNAAPSNDKQKDLKDNRTKRIFNDPVGIAAAQNKEFGFLQEYKRDTGEKAWDVSSPVFVKGRHWGAFRIGLSLERINMEKNQIIISSIITMSIILLAAFLAVFFSVNRALKPISEITDAASKLADGNMEKKIKVDSIDEIGKLADVLERLRFSLKAAMDRIARKSG
ncbi:HAMP domain-containing protein [Desulforegula conservatrix]|uniref:HAMP domain-containing protein n=1 Tax=Desulforegula conservatrix TaxID=153026 RepID=UPI0003FF9A9B|nr:HAMP domain-containing protein [Desulforegula conservatrix]